MNARITMTHLCGPLGQALAVVDNVTWLYEDKQRRLPTANEINFFFSQGLEVRPIDPLRDGELTEENLPSLLELETRRFQALQGLLIGMDAEIEDQLRIRNMRRGNRLLSDHRVSQFVERRFIRPLNGQEWDLEGARRLAHSEELLAVLRLYKIIIGPSLIRLEDEITAWALQHGYTSIERAAEIRKAYDTGLIALLATSMHDDEPSELLKRVFFAKSADWDRRLATYLVRRLVPKEPFADAVSGRLVEEDSPDLSTTTGADRLRSRIGELLEEYNSNRSKWERERYRVDHAQAYEAALKQIEWIAMRFKSHHPEAAWGDLTKLAERQFTEGGPQKFAMSLTNLATQLGENASVAFTLYDMAVNCASEDVTVHTARAETLRALGRFDEALAAYDRIVEDFPHDTFARTGRAETLRALERFDEALAAYDRTVKDFPQNAFARNGRAVVLADAGRLDEARKALQSAVQEPISAEDWVAVHILSMIELRAGATDGLATNLEDYAASCPYREHRRYFKTSLAVLRISLNRIKEARRTIEDLSVQPEFDQDERAALKLIKAHAEAADGDFVAARRSIAAVSNIVPYEEFRLRQLRREIEGRFGLGDRPSLTKPEELATEDEKLMRLEMNFFVDRARASAMSKAA
ncbi:MAG: tetratricopeptide repeat protein [Xanthobacteraceae bacterium]